MLLDRIDIDAHGPLSRVELGPFSEHLNVISGPQGSGKTALVRFVRDSLLQREYPLGMMSSSAGRIVWADRHGLVHCRRETDGSPTGRRTIEFERRGGFDSAFPGHVSQNHVPQGHVPQGSHNAYHGHGWLGGAGGIDDDQLAFQTVQLPESLVDGIMTDTSVSRVARVVASAITAGLDREDLHRDLPLHHDSFTTAQSDLTSSRYDRNSASLRAELADIDAELNRLRRRTHDDGYARDSHDPTLPGRSAWGQSSRRRQHLRDRLESCHREAHGLRVKHDEMRRWLSVIDRDLDLSDQDDRLRDRYASLEQLPGYRYRDTIENESLRTELDRTDDDMLQIRRVIEQIRDLQSVVAEAGKVSPPVWSTPWDAAAIADARYQSFVHAIDHFGASHDWTGAPVDDFWTRAAQHGADQYGGRPYRSIHEIDARIEAACSQIESLIRRAAGPKNWTDGSDPVTRLQSIRHDLESVRWNSNTADPYSAKSRYEILDRDARWLGEALSKLNHHREHLLRRAAERRQRPAYGDVSAESMDRSWFRQTEYYALLRDRKRCVVNLRDMDARLHHVLADAAMIRREMHHLPIADDTAGMLPTQVRSDLYGSNAYDSSVYDSNRPRIEFLQRRRIEILTRLQATRTVTTSRGPLAEIASRWLVRLSGGTMHRIDWNRHDSHHASPTVAQDSIRVVIDGRHEEDCPVAVRTLATMAVRMAAGQVLEQIGRPVPLILEVGESGRQLGVHTSLDHSHIAYADHGAIGRINDPIAAALRDYCGGGRQIILLTSDETLAGQLSRVGARSYRLQAERTVHPTRPLWRPHYAPESYTGPLDREPLSNPLGDGVQDHPWDHSVRYDDNRSREIPRRSGVHGGPSRFDDVNHALDAAWLEQSSDALPRTDWAMPHSQYRNGYDYSDRFTTSAGNDPYPYDAAGGASASPLSSSRVHETTRGSIRHDESLRHGSFTGGSVRGESSVVSPQTTVGTVSTNGNMSAVDLKPANPYFLSVDSPIDQAPSIDAVAASRLRAMKVTHVNHLMQRDSNRLADALGLTHVDANTVRRWQAECRLVCQIPQLRGFDARVLVGCGVTTPAQLGSVHPMDLLRDVEAFLATGRGQKILLSGSSQELSRLTSWIAAANAGFHQDHDAFDRDRYEVTGDETTGRRKVRRRYLVDADGNRIKMLDDDLDDGYDGVLNADGREYDSRAGGRSIRNRNRSGSGSGAGKGFGTGTGTGTGNGRANRSRSGSLDRYGSSSRSSSSSRRSSPSGSRSSRGRSTSNRSTSRSSDRTRRDYEPRTREYSRRESRDSYDRQPRERDSIVRYEREDRPDRPDREARVERENRSERETRAERSQRSQREPRDGNRDWSSLNRESRGKRGGNSSSERELRFYLHRQDPVVDAPSIGPRMAARLEAIGIVTVDDLLLADAETIAEQLNHRRTDADTVRLWQHQTTLCCRIPMLRGHDAQLLVAAEITTPEEITEYTPEQLFAVIDPIANSAEGKRIVRGGSVPDLEEVADWIRYAGHHRELQAA